MKIPRLLPSLTMLAFLPARGFADTPGAVEITCDVDRTQFRSAARTSPPDVTFRLWSDSDPGAPDSQIGPDYTIALSDLNVIKRYTDRYDGVGPRKTARIQAAIGSDASPVVLPVGGVAYLDLTVGSTTLGCDHAASGSTTARRRLQAVAFARESNHSETCETCESIASPVSARVAINSNHVIANSALTSLSWDAERWDTGCPGAGVFDGGAPSRLTACSTGKYLVFANITWNNFPTGYRFAGLRVNGAPPLIASQQTTADVTTNSDSSISTVIDLAAGDYVEVVVFQNNGTPVEVSPSSAPPASTAPAFGITKLHD